MRHSDAVMEMYKAFGRGDVPAILNRLAEDVEWEYGLNSTDIPWLQPRRGRARVAEFFQALQSLDILRFQPTTVLESGDTVVALSDFEATVRATGMRIVEPEIIHIWHFGPDGLATRFRHRTDTHQQWLAYHGGQA